mgnify:CR=1 FL=1
MRIDRETSLFFDASVLVAGAYSLSGGSALLLAACQAGGFRAQTTSAVLLESIDVLEGFPSQSLRRLYRLLVEIDWQFLPVPPAEVLARYERYVASKDVHVLAAAVEGGSQFLLTLDRRHLLAAAEAVRDAPLPIVILRPGDFIQQYYPRHERYPELPPARRR